jgi:hypothetical protein
MAIPIETQLQLLQRAQAINVQWIGFDLQDLVLLVLSYLDACDLEILKRITIDQLREKGKDAEKVYTFFPGFESHPAHLLSVRLMAILIDCDHIQLSEAVPSLGLTGSYSSFFFISAWDWLCKATVVHDVTDSLAQAGFPKLNKSLFYFKDSVPSAVMASGLFFFQRYKLDRN